MRYGYRRIHVLLLRDGWHVNEKRVHRLYREMGLQLRHKTPKRRVKAKLRDDRQAATGSNEVWAMDFVHDQTAMGTKIRILTIVDTFTRFSTMSEARRIIEAWRVDYNEECPHTSLNGLTPNEFARRSNEDHNQNGVYL